LTGVLYLSVSCCNLERLLAMKRLSQITETNEAEWEKVVRSPEQVNEQAKELPEDSKMGNPVGRR
jgi:hypothetical protein